MVTFDKVVSSLKIRAEVDSMISSDSKSPSHLDKYEQDMCIMDPAYGQETRDLKIKTNVGDNKRDDVINKNWDDSCHFLLTTL